jgi:hypothetical protein
MSPSILKAFLLEFDLDTDELDETAVVHSASPRSRGGSDMPPLLGLVHSSRRSTDIPLQHVTELAGSRLAGETMDSDVLKLPAASTGGMIESIANMANSILGAGIIGSSSAIF